jgi:hypothetical protein
VGAVNLSPTDRQPGHERGVQVGDRVEAPAGDHVVAVDRHLSRGQASTSGCCLTARPHPQQKWEPNDFIDIVALPAAAVSCNALVTE